MSEWEPLGVFRWKWPEYVEEFDRGWQTAVVVGANTAMITHRLGARTVYGRRRVHSVTWVNGQPAVEGVEADDYASSRSLISLLKTPERKHVRSPKEVLPQYTRFSVVGHNDEIKAPRSPKSLAVKIREDDCDSWATHALLRLRPGETSLETSESAATSLGTTPSQEVAVEGLLSSTAHDVVAGLLEYGKHVRYSSLEPLSTNPSADKLLHDDGFAFLLAVIFDQSITAERAWLAPYLLKQRLGHLDPQRIVDNPAIVASVIARGRHGDALHRYVRTLPKWVGSAARRVIDEYGGDASRIWADSPTASGLFDRLVKFQGIGQKKAAMAVEILTRHLNVPVNDLTGTDVAYDRHIRRVFLRTGLAINDDPKEMIGVARQLHPERPGAIDIRLG